MLCAASGIGVLIPLGELEENDLFIPIVDVVEHPVGSDSQTILGGEPRHNELSGKFLRPFSLGPRRGRERSDGRDDGFLVAGRHLGQRFLE